MQVVDLGGDALQCCSVVPHGGVAIRGINEIVKITEYCFRVGAARASSVWGCFERVGQRAIHRQIKAIGRYILVDQVMLKQFLEQIMLSKGSIFNDMMTFKDDVTGRHLLLLHRTVKGSSLSNRKCLSTRRRASWAICQIPA
ncbi:hypothetical protein XabCFBP2524_16700 [Xanthomonas axonopodis pv. begoniae]|nr:hypothetical protein XabCFBP2524_16700 [Xanthomonas axonopodis pv. begoniae]